jgi:hypothetical protein
MRRRFFRYRWEQSRGDDFDAWGASTWLFATDAHLDVEQQYELYDDGHVLAYDLEHVYDQFGMLADQPFDPCAPGVSEISQAAFEDATASLHPSNRP